MDYGYSRWHEGSRECSDPLANANGSQSAPAMAHWHVHSPMLVLLAATRGSAFSSAAAAALSYVRANSSGVSPRCSRGEGRELGGQAGP